MVLRIPNIEIVQEFQNSIIRVTNSGDRGQKVSKLNPENNPYGKLIA